MIPAPWLPYIAIALLLVFSGSNWFSYSKGREHATDHIRAELADKAALTKEAQDAALMAAAAQISKLDIKNTTIRAKTEVITREVPVYRDCLHDDRTFRLLNDALSPAGAKSSGGGQLPATDPAGR